MNFLWIALLVDVNCICIFLDKRMGNKIAVRPAEVFKIWLDYKEGKVYMTNLKTGQFVIPGGISMT